MATGTPVWTQGVSVITAQVLALGASVRGTLDLQTKWGARIFARLGRGGTTALSGGTTPGVDLIIRALNNNGAAGTEHPGNAANRLSQVAAATSTTVAADSNAAQNVLQVTTVTGYAAGDLICIQDSGAGVTRLEFHRISKTDSGPTPDQMTLDRPLGFTHTLAQADTVRNKADVYAPIWIPGGSLYEIIWDYGDDTAGNSVTVVTTAQTYDSDSLA